MADPLDPLASSISEFIRTTPSELVRLVGDSLQEWDSSHWELSKARLIASIHSPSTKVGLNKILDLWKQDYPQLPGISLAFAFDATLATLAATQRTSIELAWTGPLTSDAPLRRTDQALLQLVENARERLLIVSFAVYKANAILTALESSIRRGVGVHICLEDAEESQGKVTFSGISAFGKSIFQSANFYYWPLEKRPMTEDGKHGSLHAKLAVADRQSLFISSANLTGYAMELNMEMGVLIKDSDLAGQVDRMIEDLIIQGILRKTHYDRF